MFPNSNFCPVAIRLVLHKKELDTHTNQSIANNKETSSGGALIVEHNMSTNTRAAEGTVALDMEAAVQDNLSTSQAEIRNVSMENHSMLELCSNYREK